MPFLLAHLSDPHLGPLPPPRAGELMGKRLTGYLNWKRRKNLHNMDVLARVVADMKLQAPDHVMMTGDALNLGLADEFAPAERWMRGLGDPSNVSFVPGNHDVYTRRSLSYMQETFAPWMQGDRGGGAFPYLRERRGVALIGVSSAIPTAPFLASGEVGATQLGFLAKMLELTRARGMMRVVMIHHPPWRGGATPGRGLRDAGAFERVIAEHGAELIVHGHNHRPNVHHLAGPAGRVPVVGAPSASAQPGSPRHLAGYHLYRVEKIGPTWRILARARGLTRPAGAVQELDNLPL